MPDHVSHSQINMWQRCPRQWYYRYVRGLRLPPSGPLILGGSYHTALEVNFKQKVISQADLPINDCLDAFSASWDGRVAGAEDIDWQERKPGELKDMGVALVGTYRTKISPTVQPALVEQPFISEIAGVKFVLIMDLQDTNEIVIDHKTAGKSYTQDDVDRDIQASAVSHVLGRPITFQNHIALKLKVPRIQILETTRGPEDTQWWLNMAEMIVEQMKTGIAPPRPTGWWCSEKWCGYHKICKTELSKTYR